MQPLANGQQQNIISIFDNDDDDDNQPKIENLGLVNDRDVENMSREEVVELYKKAKITIISQNSKNTRMAQELDDSRNAQANAVAQATRRQAAANIVENQQNRRDFQALGGTATLCTVGRVVSLVASIAMFIISMVFFFV